MKPAREELEEWAGGPIGPGMTPADFDARDVLAFVEARDREHASQLQESNDVLTDKHHRAAMAASQNYATIKRLSVELDAVGAKLAKAIKLLNETVHRDIIDAHGLALSPASPPSPEVDPTEADIREARRQLHSRAATGCQVPHDRANHWIECDRLAAPIARRVATTRAAQLSLAAPSPEVGAPGTEDEVRAEPGRCVHCGSGMFVVCEPCRKSMPFKPAHDFKREEGALIYGPEHAGYEVRAHLRNGWLYILRWDGDEWHYPPKGLPPRSVAKLREALATPPTDARESGAGPTGTVCGECGTLAPPTWTTCIKPGCKGSWAPGPDFCSECDCIAGNGQRGYHMGYAQAGGPMTCAFCPHSSVPVPAAQAFGIGELERRVSADAHEEAASESTRRCGQVPEEDLCESCGDRRTWEGCGAVLPGRRAP